MYMYMYLLTCRHLRHKNLVQLVGLVFLGSKIHAIIMELMGKVWLMVTLVKSCDLLHPLTRPFRYYSI